jgi:hypothetical protein
MARHALGLLASVLICLVVGEGEARDREVDRAPIEQFLRTYVGNPKDNEAARYSIAPVSLHGQDHHFFVYLTGPFCGSGGCTGLLLGQTASSFKVIDRFTLVQLPIKILQSKSNGWNDIAMPVHGGGILPGHIAWLRFNGRKYPSNPSLAPTLPPKFRAGTVLPLSEEGHPLY